MESGRPSAVSGRPSLADGRPSARATMSKWLEEAGEKMDELTELRRSMGHSRPSRRSFGVAQSANVPADKASPQRPSCVQRGSQGPRLSQCDVDEPQSGRPSAAIASGRPSGVVGSARPSGAVPSGRPSYANGKSPSPERTRPSAAPRKTVQFVDPTSPPVAPRAKPASALPSRADRMAVARQRRERSPTQDTVLARPPQPNPQSQRLPSTSSTTGPWRGNPPAPFTSSFERCDARQQSPTPPEMSPADADLSMSVPVMPSLEDTSADAPVSPAVVAAPAIPCVPAVASATTPTDVARPVATAPPATPRPAATTRVPELTARLTPAEVADMPLESTPGAELDSLLVRAGLRACRFRHEKLAVLREFAARSLPNTPRAQRPLRGAGQDGKRQDEIVMQVLDAARNSCLATLRLRELDYFLTHQLQPVPRLRSEKLAAIMRIVRPHIQ